MHMPSSVVNTSSRYYDQDLLQLIDLCPAAELYQASGHDPLVRHHTRILEVSRHLDFPAIHQLPTTHVYGIFHIGGSRDIISWLPEAPLVPS